MNGQPSPRSRSRREAHRASVRQDIFQAARMLFAEKGLDFTMQEVALAAGLAKGTVYLYFQDKEDLIQALVLESLERLEGLYAERLGTARTALEKLLALGLAYVDLYERHPEQFSQVGAMDFLTPGLGWAEDNPTPLGRKVQQIKDLIRSLLVEGQREGSIRADVPVDLSSFLMSQAVKVFVQSVASAEKAHGVQRLCGYDARQLILGLFDIFLRAFSPGGPP